MKFKIIHPESDEEWIEEFENEEEAWKKYDDGLINVIPLEDNKQVKK